MRALRKMVLGETWALPLAVGALVAAALVLRSAAPELWDDAGGFLLLAGAVVALTAALPRRQARTPTLPTAPVSPTQPTQP
jgi:hypothetical protein